MANLNEEASKMEITGEKIKNLITGDMLEEIAFNYNEAAKSNRSRKNLFHDIGDVVIFAIDEYLENVADSDIDSVAEDSRLIDVENANHINNGGY